MKTVLYVIFLNVLSLTQQEGVSVRLSGPALVQAEEGKPVMISCEYSQSYRDNTKYWCRGHVYELCKIVVKTSGPTVRDRSTITEDKDAGVFKVIISSLRLSDKDKYWCVIAKPGRNAYTGLHLNIHRTGVVRATTRLTTSSMNSTMTLTRENETWCWGILRWILFILLLGYLMTTHFWKEISARAWCLHKAIT